MTNLIFHGSCEIWLSLCFLSITQEEKYKRILYLIPLLFFVLCSLSCSAFDCRRPTMGSGSTQIINYVDVIQVLFNSCVSILFPGCNHGLSSSYSARFSGRADGIWCFNDRLWISMYFCCLSLDFARWFWSLGRHLGKQENLNVVQTLSESI